MIKAIGLTYFIISYFWGCRHNPLSFTVTLKIPEPITQDVGLPRWLSSKEYDCHLGRVGVAY